MSADRWPMLGRQRLGDAVALPLACAGIVMSSYRLYRLGSDNHILSVVNYEGSDDDAAIAEAIRLDHATSIEIWTGTRRVGIVHPETGATELENGSKDD